MFGRKPRIKKGKTQEIPWCVGVGGVGCNIYQQQHVVVGLPPRTHVDMLCWRFTDIHNTKYLQHDIPLVCRVCSHLSTIVHVWQCVCYYLPYNTRKQLLLHLKFDAWAKQATQTRVPRKRYISTGAGEKQAPLYTPGDTLIKFQSSTIWTNTFTCQYIYWHKSMSPEICL